MNSMFYIEIPYNLSNNELDTVGKIPNETLVKVCSGQYCSSALHKLSIL